MGDLKALLNIPRRETGYRPIHERITDFSQVEQTLNSYDHKLQASHCMECGVSFYHWACPLSNKQPELQNALYKEKWREAYQVLNETNDLPEFTGHIRPAFCEKSCVLKLSYDVSATICENEAATAEAASREGYVVPARPKRNGKKIVVISAGPSGLSVAVRLNAHGYEVTIFNLKLMPGGLLRYEIPNFKLPKEVIDRRVDVPKAEGIRFEMGVPIDVWELPAGFDTYAACTGAPTARDPAIPGRELKGIHFALDMLTQQNRILDEGTFPKEQLVNAKGKRMLVIGGGDIGSDYTGISVRQGAASVTQIEIMPQPPIGHNDAAPWSQRPAVLKTISSHKERCTRCWSLASNRFIGKSGRICDVEVEEVERLPVAEDDRPTMQPTGKEEITDTDMVLPAIRFLKPEQPELAENVFVAGDVANDASLVVRALADGRKAARQIDLYCSR